MKTQEIKDDWTRTKESLLARWEELTEHDLEYVNERMRNLIIRIQKRTTEPKQSLEKVVATALPEINRIASHRLVVSRTRLTCTPADN